MAVQDPNVAQAWMMAIPTAITAISTWYLSRQTKKTVGKSDTNTERLVSEQSVEVTKRLKSLEDRMEKVESSINKTRDTQIILAQKHVETVNTFSSELKAAKAAFARLAPGSMGKNPAPMKDPNPALNGAVPAPMKEPEEAGGKIVVVDEPPQPHGKVIRKP